MTEGIVTQDEYFTEGLQNLISTCCICAGEKQVDIHQNAGGKAGEYSPDAGGEAGRNSPDCWRRIMYVLT
jgi:hypothetical protein